MLDPPAISLSGCEVTQHPSISILAGFDPQTSSLKPRHSNWSPVLARETAGHSLLYVRKPQKRVQKAETAKPYAPRHLTDGLGEFLCVRVLWHAGTDTEE